MTELSRRTFLSGAALAGAGLAVGGPQTAAAAAKRKKVRRIKQQVVIIGSGFGGGVSALRLAQAGVPVLVLERGRRWPAGPNSNTFPSVTTGLDQRALWYGTVPVPSTILGLPLGPVVPYAGLLEAIVGDGMIPICAAGVGGGSLVYQGMTLQPAEAVFHECMPEKLDYRRMSRVHYPRVARMLGAATAPDELIASAPYNAARVFKRNATAAGMTVEKIPMPIDWSFALRELKGEMRPSYTNGDCALGVNNGGKHSVDVTYLAEAERTGRVQVAPLHNVRDIERTKDGAWKLTVDHTDVTGRLLEHKIITTRTLIMGAGANNTTRLLVRAAALGHIPDMPDALGSGWGSNGDAIYAWTSPLETFGASQGGPVIYGSKDWSRDAKTANTIIQASLPPLGVEAHSTMLVGFGVSPSRGRWIYSGGSDVTTLHWPRGGDKAVQKVIDSRIRTVAGPASVLVNLNDAARNTWHGLGGACMETVCDLDGRVHDQPGLYVLDGALIPGSTGACNPSMTIAAVAERAMENIVKKDVGKTIL